MSYSHTFLRSAGLWSGSGRGTSPSFFHVRSCRARYARTSAVRDSPPSSLWSSWYFQLSVPVQRTHFKPTVEGGTLTLQPTRRSSCNSKRYQWSLGGFVLHFRKWTKTSGRPIKNWIETTPYANTWRDLSSSGEEQHLSVDREDWRRTVTHCVFEKGWTEVYINTC